MKGNIAKSPKKNCGELKVKVRKLRNEAREALDKKERAAKAYKRKLKKLVAELEPLKVAATETKSDFKKRKKAYLEARKEWEACKNDAAKSDKKKSDKDNKKSKKSETAAKSAKPAKSVKAATSSTTTTSKTATEKSPKTAEKTAEKSSAKAKPKTTIKKAAPAKSAAKPKAVVKKAQRVKPIEKDVKPTKMKKVVTERAPYAVPSVGGKERLDIPVKAENAPVNPKKAKPRTRKAVSGGKDDLTKIEGIGPKIAEILATSGIQTFQHLADAKLDRLNQLMEEAGPRYRIHKPTTWSEQADLAAKGDWDKLKTLQAALNRGKR